MDLSFVLAVPWTNRLQNMGSWIRLYAFLTLAPVLTQCARGSCPRDVEARAAGCFTSYSFHSQSLYNSPHKLCCGVDVETLRGFCHSYRQAVSCVKQLKRSCPSSEHPAIEKSLSSLDQTKAGVKELCSNDNFIEPYAMYQDCLLHVGRRLETCLASYFHNSTNIRFLSKVNTKKKDVFCRNMRGAMACIQQHVHHSCGAEAARLSLFLVRPMVQESSDCDYSIVDSTATSEKKLTYVDKESRPNRRRQNDNSDKTSNHNRRHQNKNKSRNSYTSNMHGANGPNSAAGSLRGVALVHAVLFPIVSIVISCAVYFGLLNSGD